MTADTEARKPRADALRNRERLIEAAKQVFTEDGADASLEAIAKHAGVGIGTLYRHFPTRDDVIEAVYRREVEALAAAAESLAASQPPLAALDAWLRLFIDYMATKRVVGPALGARPGGASALYETSGSMLRSSVSLLIERAKAAGELRADIETEDMMQALSGIAYGASTPGWETRALRLVEVLMSGLRA